MADGLEIEVVTAGPPAVVVVRGEIDVATSPDLDAIIGSLTAGDVILDLAGVSFMGSSGLASLLRADRHSIGLGGKLALRAPSQPVRDVLEMTRLLERFTIVDT